MEVLGDVATYVFVQQECTTGMPLGKLSDVKNQVVEDDQLLSTFLYFHLELFVAHHIQRLVELDRVLTQESLMEEL